MPVADRRASMGQRYLPSATTAARPQVAASRYLRVVRPVTDWPSSCGRRAVVWYFRTGGAVHPGQERSWPPVATMADDERASRPRRPSGRSPCRAS